LAALSWPNQFQIYSEEEVAAAVAAGVVVGVELHSQSRTFWGVSSLPSKKARILRHTMRLFLIDRARKFYAIKPKSTFCVETVNNSELSLLRFLSNRFIEMVFSHRIRFGAVFLFRIVSGKILDNGKRMQIPAVSAEFFRLVK
jgi:hypothetical protein